ncbi:MAG: UDP-glucose 6-dehydrogenase, partial [Propionibacteriaceae bacterium]|nr:UDP-glucose 6-dehydrogenase [Propionibacteriaceae bacterium]
MKIVVVGTGYVGLSNAVILAQHHDVVAVDINASKVQLINARKSPIEDAELEDYLANVPLSLEATTDAPSAYQDAQFVVVATPTDYDPVANFFNTCSVESTIADALVVNPAATIVIKSTVPVGFTERMRARHPKGSIIFSPEFLREG